MNNLSKGCLVIGFVACTLWFVQYSVQKVLDFSNQPILAQKIGKNNTETESIVTDAFEAVGLQPPPLGESIRDESSDIQQEILERLKKTAIELYVLDRKDSIRWRIYNKDSLQYQISFSKVASLSSEKVDSIPLTVTRTSPVALLLTGTKYKDLEPLLKLDIPLNLALEPTSPFGLRNAVLGARHWHEIVLDIRHSSEFVLDALPFATTLLSTTKLSIDKMHVITTADTQAITTATSDFPKGNIWRLDMTKLSTNDVETWLKSLPETIRFVRLSYWDIAPK